MPRFFVNSMSNFMIQGGVVSFTLQDVAMKTQGGAPKQADPEDIVDVVMREQDFAQLVQFFNQHLAAYQQQSGKAIGAGPKAGSAPVAKVGGSGPAAGGGFKIRPKGS